jgi:hypothetical protein
MLAFTNKLLGDLTQPALARSAGLGLSTVVDFERERRAVSDVAIAAIRAALEAAAVTRHNPRAEILGLWLADQVLAQRLNWPYALPLLIGHLAHPALQPPGAARAARPGAADWDRMAGLAYAQAAAAAADLAGELFRKAQKFVALAPKSRAPAAKTVSRAFLERDAVTASMRFSGMSDRGLRRLCDRLVDLGAIRELTGRPTFRIYGL